jgi:hypothetical protein
LTDNQWTEASVRFSALHTENKALNARVVDLEERIDEIWQHLQLHGWVKTEKQTNEQT